MAPLKAFAHKGNHNQNANTVYRMGKIFAGDATNKGINPQNMQKSHTSQYKKRQPSWTMSRKYIWILRGRIEESRGKNLYIGMDQKWWLCYEEMEISLMEIKNQKYFY